MIQASYKYPDGSEYKGEWNAEGQRHGIGRRSCFFSRFKFGKNHFILI